MTKDKARFALQTSVQSFTLVLS